MEKRNNHKTSHGAKTNSHLKELFGCSESLRESLDGVAVVHDEHDRNSGDLADSTLQVFITGGNNVTAILEIRHSMRSHRPYSLHDTVISVRSFVGASQTLETRVLCQTESEMVARTELFQFRHHTVRDVGNALCQKAIHHALYNVQLVLNREVYKVGIDEDAEWRTQRRIVFEEHAGRDLLLTNNESFRLRLLLLFSLLHVLRYSVVLCRKDLGPNSTFSRFRSLGHFFLEN